MSEEVKDEALTINVTITGGKIEYSHNMPPQQLVFWLEAVKSVVVDTVLNGRKEDK